jgi:transcriptional regulator with XRE-family HTH domain
MSSVTEIKERIKTLISAKGLTSAKFADIIGVQRSGISHILSGRNKPGLDVLYKILANFPDISGDWLITGEGDMYKSRPEGREQTNELFPLEEAKETASEPENVNREEDMPHYGRPKQYPHGRGSTKEPEAAGHELNTTSTDTGKTIEKVVVFYSDRTFREYRPE